MSGSLVALALCLWGPRDRVGYQRHVRRVAQIEHRLALRMVYSEQSNLQAMQA